MLSGIRRRSWLNFAHLTTGTNGHLRRTTTAPRHLAKSCHDPCSCTIVDSYDYCDCITGDYGTKSTQPANATVTITGSLTPYPLYVSGSEVCAAPASCASINGSYSVSCGSEAGWCIGGYVCNAFDSGGNAREWYYVQAVEVDWSDPGIVQARVHSAVQNRDVGSGNPYPTLTSCTIGLGTGHEQLRFFQWANTTTYNGWVYVLGGDCTTSCNTTTTRTGCITTGSKTWGTTTDNTPFNRNHCDLSGLTVALSLS